MTAHHSVRNITPLNPNVAAFVLIFNFILISGLMIATLPASPTDGEADAVAVLVQPTATPLPPTTTPLPEPTLTATLLPPTAAPAVEQPEAASVVVDGDAANGQVLFNTFQPAASFACSTCHLVVSEDRSVGPGLLNISVRAETRVPGQGVYEYLHESIVNPDAYIVADFVGALMPANWAEIYTEQEINDIIAYLLTLK